MTHTAKPPQPVGGPVSRFRLHPLPLEGAMRLERIPICDNRGLFERLFCALELSASGWSGPVAQVNRTWTSRRGTLRGMHFQRSPHTEIKLVNCVRGEVWDVVIDLRRDSPTFLRWHGEHLSAADHAAMLVPRGFAHGFQALTDDVELVYLHSAPHVPESESGIDALDPALSIVWPLPIAERSPRDIAHVRIGPEFEGLSP